MLQIIVLYSILTILLGLTIFQVALIAGAPVGRFAWGGQHKVLPRKLRVASVYSIFIYIFIALVALGKAGVVTLGISPSIVATLTWIIFIYFVLGIFMNVVSRSIPERLVMTPVATVLAAGFLVLALA